MSSSQDTGKIYPQLKQIKSDVCQYYRFQTKKQPEDKVTTIYVSFICAGWTSSLLLPYLRFYCCYFLFTLKDVCPTSVTVKILVC